MRISDWSSDVCSSDLAGVSRDAVAIGFDIAAAAAIATGLGVALGYAVTTLFPRGYVPEFLMAPVLLVTVIGGFVLADIIKHETGLITVTVMGVVMANRRSEEHTSELQSLMRISYA